MNHPDLPDEVERIPLPTAAFGYLASRLDEPPKDLPRLREFINGAQSMAETELGELWDRVTDHIAMTPDPDQELVRIIEDDLNQWEVTHCPTTTPEPHELGEFPMSCYRCHLHADS